MDEFTLEPPNGREPKTHGLGIQHPNHYNNHKTYVKCKYPVFMNIKQTFHYKVAIE